MHALHGYRCGVQKFGKCYAPKSYSNEIISVGSLTSPINLEQINPEVARAIARLQKAKKEEIYPAIRLCLEYYSKYYYVAILAPSRVVGVD